MKSTSRYASVGRPPVIEGLEGRTLLSSAWVGTWNVQLTHLDFQGGVQSDGASGSMTAPTGTELDTAVITQTGPGQFHLAAGQAPHTFQIDLTGTEDALQGGWKGQIADGSDLTDVVFRLRRFEGNIVSIYESQIDYKPTNKKVMTGAELTGGFAAPVGTPLSFARFPWQGTYTTFSAEMEGQAVATGFDSTVVDKTGTITITPVDGVPNAYMLVSDKPGDTPEQWTLEGNQLVHTYQNQSSGGSSVQSQWDVLTQGPGGRLFYLGGGAEFNTTSPYVNQFNRTIGAGQMTDVWLDSGYTAPFKAAPVLIATPAMHLKPINEDDRANLGTSIPDLIASSGIDSITDLNQGAKEGIALTGVDSVGGKWQYSTDGGATWLNVGAVSDTSALLLASNAQNRLRLRPSVDYNGTVSDAITFRAWDQTAKTNGARVDVSNNGGSRAYSSGTATASIRVKPVNDAPVLAAPATFVLLGAAKNTNFSISFDTLVAKIQAVTSYSDVDTAQSSLGFRVTALSGTLKQNGASVAGPVVLMSGGSIAWRPALNATGRITALKVEIWDGLLPSSAFVTVIIKVG